MPKHRFVVRLWVDVEVTAETQEKAKEIADRLPIGIEEGMREYDASFYQIQTEKVWRKDGEML